MKNTRFAWFLGIYTALMLCAPSFATDFALNPARDFGAIRRINPTDYDGYAVVRENGAGLSSGTAAAFRAALEVFSKAEAEPAGAVATHAGLTATHGATGAVVGTTNTQALTNKTLTDASNHISGSVIDSGTVADANIASTIARDSEYIAADSAVLSACNASDALNLRLDGSRAMTGNLRFSGNCGVAQSTSDGADNGWVGISGGGAFGVTRGGTIYACGNEYEVNTQAGQIQHYAGNVSTGDHIFYTGAGTERFRIAYDGTNTSTGKFYAYNDATEAMKVYGYSADVTSGNASVYNGEIILGRTAPYQGRISYGGGVSGQENLYLTNIYDHPNGGIVFRVNAAGTPKDAMKVSGGARVLIGTTTDDGSNKLQVTGNAKITGSTFHVYNAGDVESIVQAKGPNTSTGYDAKLTLTRKFNADYSVKMFTGATFGGGAGASLNISTDYWDGSAVATATRLKIDGYTGNLLIGTTTDDGSNKLQVTGNAKITGTIESTGAATVGGDLTVTGAGTNFRNAIKSVDGAGSGLDADTVPNATPASGAAGTAGMIRYDANYIYICVAANTWKRAAISTW